MKVGIVCLDPKARERVSRFLETLPGCALVFSLSPEEAVIQACQEHRPQVVLMGLEGGAASMIALTRDLVACGGVSILLLDSGKSPNVSRVYDILGAGAQDVARVPGLQGPSAPEAFEDLRNRLETLRALMGSNRRATVVPAPDYSRVPIVAIGASTGGPQALKILLSGLPKDFPFAVVVVQHLDPHFYDGLASWLDRASPLTVLPLVEEAWPAPSVVRIAARADHVVLGRDGKLRFSKGRQDLVSRPSADVFFETLAEHPEAVACGILLTGMGRDGAQGLLRLRKAGVRTFAQDEASSVIYGMPRVAKEIGAADRILPLDQMAPALIALAKAHQGAPEVII